MPQPYSKPLRSRLYHLLYAEGPLSRPQLAEKLGISLPTAIQYVKALMAEGLLCPAGLLQSTGGRRAEGVDVAVDAHYALGCDITRNHISLALVNIKADILAARRVHRRFENSPAYFAHLQEMAAQLLQQAGVPPALVLGGGVSIPGVVDEGGNRLRYSHVLQVSGLSAGLFTQALGCRCVLCNDANAAGIAEMWGQDAQRAALYFSLSDSVGGAVLLGGQALHGENQRSGEFGHMNLVQDGLPCYCGRLGCVDAYCNATVLSRHSKGSLESFFTRLNNADPALQPVWQQYVGWLAVAANNLVTAFDSPLILGGYLGEYLEPRLPEIRSRVAGLTTFSGNEEYIVACRYKRKAAAVGAALLWVAPFLQNI